MTRRPIERGGTFGKERENWDGGAKKKRKGVFRGETYGPGGGWGAVSGEEKVFGVSGRETRGSQGGLEK